MMKRLSYFLISLLVAFTLPLRASGPVLTQISDVVYRADGSPARGTLTISWNAFTSVDGFAVAANKVVVTLGTNGALSVQLAPNAGATPAGSFYKVVLNLGGDISTEYWVVPAASPTTVAAIRSTVMPATVAAQFASVAYSTLNHCFALFNGTCSGIIGGLYNGAIDSANCLAGFSIMADASGNATVAPIINGSPAGSSQSVAALSPGALTTRFYCQAPFRTHTFFHSSAHPSGSARGGDTIAAEVRVVLTIEPADGSAATPTVLYDGVLANAPAFCTYALINGGVLNASLSHTRMSRENAAEVQTTSSGATRTRIQGSTTGGAECEVLTTTRTLLFYHSTANAPGDLVVARYRSSGRAVAAAVASPAPQNSRPITRTILEPPVRTAIDCENAALALLDDGAGAISGQYNAWSDSLGGDIWPGDALALNLPSRQITATAIAREVDLDLVDLATDHAQYAIKFANDAAAALAFEFEIGGGSKAARPLAPAVIVPIAGTTYLPDLVHAEVTSVSAGIVNVDCGLTPPAGGGIEVRRTDTGWGLADGFNLVGRFTTQTFPLAKLALIVDFYARQFDAQGNYSRYSAALHVDMP